MKGNLITSHVLLLAIEIYGILMYRLIIDRNATQRAHRFGHIIYRI